MADKMALTSLVTTSQTREEPRIGRVEIVEHSSVGSTTGIGRYTQEIVTRLSHRNDVLDVQILRNHPLPAARWLSPLRHFPTHVAGHQAGSIVHFMQIMGCSQLLWHPVRPSIATVHDLGVLVCGADAELFNSVDRAILEAQFAGLKRLDYFVAVSDYTRQTLIDVLDIEPERIFTVWHGVDHTHYRPRPSDAAREHIIQRYNVTVEPDQRVLLYVGSELPRKNLSTLLDALAILTSNKQRVVLWKVGGSGGERWRAQFLRDIEKRGLHSHVSIFDKVSEEDLPLFFNAADCFVTASLLEGFGLPVIEAMACGTPVICSNAGALPEITAGAALLFDPNHPEALANLLIEHVDSKRQQFSTLGLTRAQEFLWDRSIDALLAVYAKMGGSPHH